MRNSTVTLMKTRLKTMNSPIIQIFFTLHHREAKTTDSSGPNTEAVAVMPQDPHKMEGISNPGHLPDPKTTQTTTTTRIHLQGQIPATGEEIQEQHQAKIQLKMV